MSAIPEEEAERLAEAAEELLRRNKARRDLLAFIQYTFPGYIPDPAHALIAAYMNDVPEKLKRIIITAPPQHGKTELVTVRNTAFLLGKNPSVRIIMASYGADLAQAKSGDTRAVVESPEFHRLFPGVYTQRDRRAVARWVLTGNVGKRGGYVVAAGVGGALTGHGADVLIIDDPVENWEQAMSQTYRDRMYDWYTSTARTRLSEHGAIIIIQTRWHEDDLAGRLIAERGVYYAPPGGPYDPTKWLLLRLPALAETQDERDFVNQTFGLPPGLPDPLGRKPGEALCPHRFRAETLHQIWREVHDEKWYALYQGTPRASEGILFRREMLPIADTTPEIAGMAIRFWDLAATVDGCRTAGVKMGLGVDGNIYVLDVVYGQWETAERDHIIRQIAEQDGHATQIWFEQEPGSAGKSVAEYFRRSLAEFTVYSEPASGKKDWRLMPFQSRAAAGKVRLVRGPWNHDYIAELMAVPGGRYRDMADASAGAYNVLVRQAALPIRPVEVRMYAS